MKIATFVFEGKQSWGLVIENPADGREWVYEPPKLEHAFSKIAGNGTNGYFRCMPKFMPDREWPATVKEFLEMGELGMERLKKLEIFLKRYMEQSDTYFISCVGHPLEDVRLRAPVPDAKLFFGLVSNSPSFFRSNPMRSHVNIIPQGHQRPRTAIIGSGETFIGELVGNVELGIVIGKECYNVPIEEAYDYVAGYTVIFDSQVNTYYEHFIPGDKEISREEALSGYDDWHADATGSWIGKGADSHCICGPYITTKDEIGNPYDLVVETKTNGMLRDHSSTAGYLIGVERLVQFFSSFMTLHPGDILHLGTVGTDGIAIDLDYMKFDNDGTVGAYIERCGEVNAKAYYPQKIGDTRSEKQKEIPLVPAAQDFIDSGMTEVDAFSLENVNSVWTCYGNFSEVEKEFSWKATSYASRVLNGPVTQLTDKSDELYLSPIAGDIEISCEMAFVIKKMGKGIAVSEADEYILGYAPLISVCDLSMSDKIIPPYTGQEKGVASVYGRWGDGYQTIGEVKNIPINGRKMLLSVDGVGEIECSCDDYLVGPAAQLKYLAHGTTVLPGDVVTLGRLNKVIRVPKEAYQNGIKVTLKADGYSEISRTVYPFEKKCK